VPLFFHLSLFTFVFLCEARAEEAQGYQQVRLETPKNIYLVTRTTKYLTIAPPRQVEKRRPLISCRTGTHVDLREWRSTGARILLSLHASFFSFFSPIAGEDGMAGIIWDSAHADVYFLVRHYEQDNQRIAAIPAPKKLLSRAPFW